MIIADHVNNRVREVVYHPETVPELPADEGEINVYPNPAKDFWHVAFNEKAVVKASVFDIMGRKIWEYGADNLYYFDIPCTNYLSGIYFLKISVNGAVQNFKLMKQ